MAKQRGSGRNAAGALFFCMWRKRKGPIISD